VGSFEAIKVTDRIWWVGAVDWQVRNFHGYLTSRGTTYNAYLLMADRITLFDTVKEPFFGEMMARIASIVEPSKIDYLVSNHSEMDHSGSIPEVTGAIKPVKVFASPNGAKALKAHFPVRQGTGRYLDSEITEVGTGDTLDLGGATLSFVETKMVHWPDSMVTYVPEEKALMSQDVFGMHMASGERFADQLPQDVLAQEAKKYYANILMPLSGVIAKALDKLIGLGLDIKIILPDHGPVWRENPMQIAAQYREWTRLRPDRKAVVVYDTMWRSTELMARAIADRLSSEGVSVKEMPLSVAHRSDVATELMGSGALVVGSPTINNQLFPTVADCLTYLKGLKPKNLVGGAFGSYGWSGEATKLVQAELDAMKLGRAAEPLRVKYVPDEAALAECREFGAAVAERVKDTVGTFPEGNG
jgi:flavorubredoxin